MSRLPIFLLLASGLVTAGLAASPDTPALRLVLVGFARQSPNRHWQPARVEIENPGLARAVTLVFEPASRANGQSLDLSKPVWLPANARRTVWLSAFPDMTEPSQPTAKRTGRPDIQTVKCFYVKLTDGHLRVYHDDYAMERFVPESALVALTTDSRSTTYRVPADVPLANARRPVNRMPVPFTELPVRSIDYDAVNLLVLGNAGPQELLALQQHAIREWVRAGGTLVLVPGPDTSDAWLENWAAIAPATFGPPDRFATDPRLSRWGESPVFANGIGFRRLTLRDDAQVLLGDRNSPLVAVRKEGLGQVVATAFDAGDLEFQHWSGATNFAAELLALAQRTPPAADRILEQSTATDAIVTSLAGIKVLGRGPLLGYLGVLLAVILGIALTFRLTRTPERGWVVAAGAALVTGGAVIVMAGQWKGQPLPFLNEIDIVHVAPDGTNALTQAALGLYSPSAATFALAAVNDTVALRPATANRVSAETFGIVLDDCVRVPALAVRQSDVRAMYGQALLPAAPQPQAGARLSSAGLELTVENPTAHGFADGFFKFNRFVAALGDLPAGAHRDYRDLRPGDTYSAHVVQSAEDQLRQRIRRVFFPDPIYTIGRALAAEIGAYRARTRLGDTGPAVYAWTNEPLFPLETGDQTLARRAIALWTVPATLRFEGPRLTLPRGLLTLRQRNKESRLIERGEGRYSGTRNAEIVAEFSLPAECPDLQIDSARVFVTFRGSAFGCRVQVQSADGTRRATLPDGPVCDLPNPAKWYDPATRSFTLAATVTALSPTGAESAAVNYWQIREFDLEIGGTVP